MDAIVESKFKIKLGKIEVEVSKEDAEALYSALFAALNKSEVNWDHIFIKEYPIYTPPARWEPWTVYYSTDTHTYSASNSIYVRSEN